MIYRVNTKELRLLQLLGEIRFIPGFEITESLDEEAEKENVNMLLEKGYLNKNENGHIEFDSSLGFMLAVMRDPYGYFFLEGNNKSIAVYFVSDTIVILDRTEDEYEFIWVPFLPYAIGAVANKLEVFMNTESDEEKIYDADNRAMVVTELTEKGFVRQWNVHVFSPLHDKNEDICEIYTDSTKQIMLKTKFGTLTSYAPAKADMVNSMTEIMAELHSKAIKESGIING